MKKNNLGFSLVELMIGVGLVGVLSLSMMHLMQQQTTSLEGFKNSGEINSLVSLLTSQLNKKSVCELNFKGLGLTNSLGSIDLTRSPTASIIRAPSEYTDRVKINSIETVPGTANQMIIKINFTPKKGNATYVDIPVNVFLNGSGLIESCYADNLAMLRLAVKYACQGGGAKYYAPTSSTDLGHCEHEIQLLRSNGAAIPRPITGGLVCPIGERLMKLDTNASNQIYFQCKPVDHSAASSCGQWEYISKINSDGTVYCKDLRTFFTGNGLMVMQGGGYQAININCSANGSTYVFQNFVNATAHCVDTSKVTNSCPANSYVDSIDASGHAHCTSASTILSSCSGGARITKVDSSGAITCGGGFTACGSNQAITAVSAAGVVTCTNVP